MARDLSLLFFAFAFCISSLEATQKAPSVQVYFRHPAEKGKENTFHCYAESFHPPKINITLLKNGIPMENVQQSDLSFKKDWTFERLVYAKVIPDGKAEFACKVEHITLPQPMIYKLDQEY
ncbi:beta-2-microglobulin [Anolis carolinensis]|uniref:beta-2-microglobulin n=2 Tax=Anolis carolinensis TaxID=28377 RepID=UPI000203AC57|nr:PREDICTED: beta-2-microglobulin [Anolis carolinensis]|eukprot:XP_003227530.1 PREDICTED: beta-2-microglobulin [Anolis carolinensis]